LTPPPTRLPEKWFGNQGPYFTAVDTRYDNIRGSFFTCPEPGAAQSIYVLIKTYSDAPQRIKCAIYRESDNRLVGVTEEVIVNKAGDWWVRLNFPEPKPKLEATNYALVAWATSPVGIWLSPMDVPRGRQYVPYTGVFPDPWNPEVFRTKEAHGIYCTYWPLVEYTLTVGAAPGGTTDPRPGTYKYPAGVSVNVKAIPDEGYKFDYWLLDGVKRTENPITILMDKDHAIAAYFKTIPKYTLTISATPGGTTDPAPGSYTYPEGTVVPVTATPYSGYYFDRWFLDGADAGKDNPINILMDKDHALQAAFAEIPPAKGTLDCHAYADTKEVAASVEIVDVGTYTTPFTVDLDPGTYTLKAIYAGQTQERTTTIVEGQTTREDFAFAAPPSLPELALSGIAASVPVLAVTGVVAAQELTKARILP